MGGVVLYRPRTAYKKRRFVKGQDRRSGFYGRFSGSRGELKFFDVTLDDAVVAGSGAGAITDSLNKIPQGVTEKERIGRKCTIKSIWWRYQVSLPGQDAGVTPKVGDSLRMILYQDKQCNGATATATDLLETATLQDFRNLANQGRFIIHMDKVVNINYGGMASDGAGVVSQAFVQRNATFYKKCNIPIEFSATTGAITEIRSNNLGVLLISAQGEVGFVSEIRLRFSDA